MTFRRTLFYPGLLVTLLIVVVQVTVSAPVSAASFCVTLVHPMALGATDEETDGEVAKLQNFLKQDNPSSAGLAVTGIFDKATQTELASWQRRHGIVSSGSPETTGYGAVGPKTRAAIANCSRTTTSVSVPYVPQPSSVPAGTGSGVIYRSLSFGSYGPDVSTLQQLLATDSSVYPEKVVSGYFGSLTEAAVKRYQAKYNIVSSGSPETTGYGAVGPKTRAALLSGPTPASPTTTPPAEDSCSLDGDRVLSGASETFYSRREVTAPETCAQYAQTRACEDGSLSGSSRYSFSSCTSEDVSSAPLVSFTSPAVGTVSGTVTVTVSATADAGVASVQFFADDVEIATVVSAPYSTQWDTTSLSDGTHTLTATVRDTVDNRATAHQNVTVTNGTPLYVTNNNSYTTAQCSAYFNTGGNQSQWAFVQDGKLTYKTVQPDGDRIPDFSFAGYRGGGVALPTVPVARTVASESGDDTARIQAAIDEVSAMPLVNGSRGAVLIDRGEFQISGTLNIKASGVVLRGSGSGEGGTELIATGTPHLLINVGGSRSLRTTGATAHITDSYVPAGTRSFNVDDSSSFSPGDKILMHRPVTAEWVAFMGMDTLVRDGDPQSWLSPGSTLKYERTITDVQGSTITVDVPLTDSFDADYTGSSGATIRHLVSGGDIHEVGIESLRAEAPVLIVPIDQPLFSFLHIDGLTDGWVKDVVAQDFESGVNLDSGARRVTVDTVTLQRTVQPTLRGGKPADFQVDGHQNLVMRSNALSSGVISYTTQSLATMNVVYDLHAASPIDPHQRWATGLLVDRATADDGIYMRNSGVLGSGHGWTIGGGVIWNSVTNEYTVQQPPGSQNWAVGVAGTLATIRVPGVTRTEPISIVDSSGTPVAVSSLYLAQLCERLGPSAVKAILRSPSNTTSVRVQTAPSGTSQMASVLLAAQEILNMIILKSKAAF